MDFPITRNKGLLHSRFSFLAVLAALICTSNAYATVWDLGHFFDYFGYDYSSRNGEIQLLHVTSDAMGGASDFKLLLNDDHEIVGVRFLTASRDGTSYTVAQLLQGVVLLRSSGYDVLKLKAQAVDPKHTAVLDLVYLSNGITNSYGTFQMEIVRRGSQFGLEVNDQSGRRSFTTMFLEARRFAGQVIGIKNVVVK